MPSLELSTKSETPLEAYKKAIYTIDRQGATIHGYYISNQLGNFVEKNVVIDSFDTHRGIVDGHGEFEVLMIRVYAVNRSLLRDWIILPDGDIWTCGVNRDNPNVLEFDTIERPTSEELIRDQEHLMFAAAIKAGLVWDDDAKEFKQPAVDEHEEAVERRFQLTHFTSNANIKIMTDRDSGALNPADEEAAKRFLGDCPEVAFAGGKNVRRGVSLDTKPPVVIADSDGETRLAQDMGLPTPLDLPREQ